MIRAYKESGDYEEISRWFDGHNFPAIAKGILPEDGFISEGKCACFIYITSNSRVQFIEWVVSNPDLSPRESAEGIEELADYMHGYAKYMFERGIMVIGVVSNNKLAKAFERNGFLRGCNGEITFCYGGD